MYGDTVPAFAVSGIDPRAILRTNAVVGKTVTTMLSQAVSAVDAYKVVGADNVAVLWGGTNDFTLGETPQQIYDKIKAWHDGRRAAGFRTVAKTLLPRADAAVGAARFDDLLALKNSSVQTGQRSLTRWQT